MWSPPEGWGAEHLAVEIDDDPCVWTDGSAEVNTLADVTVAGACVLLPALALALQGTSWVGMFDLTGVGCPLPVPSPLQCVQ